MTRAEKAQRLVDEGQVETWGEAGYEIRAYITDGPNTHFVTLYPEGEYSCDCRGVHFHCYIDDLCAHALAVKLAVAKEKCNA